MESGELGTRKAYVIFLCVQKISLKFVDHLRYAVSRQPGRQMPGKIYFRRSITFKGQHDNYWLTRFRSPSPFINPSEVDVSVVSSSADDVNTIAVTLIVAQSVRRRVRDVYHFGHMSHRTFISVPAKVDRQWHDVSWWSIKRDEDDFLARHDRHFDRQPTPANEGDTFVLSSSIVIV